METRRQEKPTQLFIADACTMFRESLRRLLEDFPGLVVVGETDDGLEAVREVSRLKPDILILSFSLHAIDGLEVLRRIRPVQRVRTVVFTEDISKENVLEASQLGVLGFVLKESPVDELIRCIQWVNTVGRRTGKPQKDLMKMRPIAQLPRRRVQRSS